ncbi:MAG: hypothetical protein FJ164_12670 [Gammaproteobacteria bacterium]|nr:hypothetical protein [Gammaproteobacteria bacterium]
MRSRAGTLCRWLALPGVLALGLAPALALAQPAQPVPPQSPAPQAESELPEYRTRSLPTDTFKPSEEVSEDFAVPFPADI